MIKNTLTSHHFNLTLFRLVSASILKFISHLDEAKTADCFFFHFQATLAGMLILGLGLKAKFLGLVLGLSLETVRPWPWP